MNNIYAHPAMCSDAHTIAALQERLGMRAVVDGRRVRLVGEPRPTGRPLPCWDNGSRGIRCADCGGRIGDDNGPPDGCLLDLKLICYAAVTDRREALER